MYKKIVKGLFSPRLTIILFVIFATAMALGTFLDASETISPSPFTNKLIYKAWWFEVIMLLFVINFSGNIFKYRLFRKEKWATLLLHLAFVLIFIGAFITRYIGYEGIMHIREGETENEFLSSEIYLTGFVKNNTLNKKAEQQNLKPKKLLLSERLANNFKLTTIYKGQKIRIEGKEFIRNVEKSVIENREGDTFLKVVEARNGVRIDHWLKEGEVVKLNNQFISFNNLTKEGINIVHDADNEYNIISSVEGKVFRMADQSQKTVLKDSILPLQLKSLYQIGNTSFVIPEKAIKGEYGLVKSSKENVEDGLKLKVTVDNESKIISLLGGKGFLPNYESITTGGMEISLAFGSKLHKIPFSLKLNDFIADKYPGTEKGYAAFKSKVSVYDPNDRDYDYDIFMNNVLDHKGYRFFQSAFDPDEKGTILSVNHDFWGTWTTYIGYFTLYLGLLGILFSKNTRISYLNKIMKKTKAKRASLTLGLCLLSSLAGMSQEKEVDLSSKVDSVIIANKVTNEHASIFGSLVLQDNGRMKPINTYASEVLRKISRKNSYKALDANQVFLSMVQYPRLWIEVPIISLERGNDSIRKIIGVPKNTKKISLIAMFDNNGEYKLKPYLEEATRTTNPNKFQKDIIKAHESFYLLNEVLQGTSLKIFPIPNDLNHKWVSYSGLSQNNVKGMDSLYTNNILPLYFQKIEQAKKTNDYTHANELVLSINDFQKKYGTEVRPTDRKISAEILYNKLDIFNRLYKYFALFGILLLILGIFQIFKDRKLIRLGSSFIRAVIVISFIAMTFGLILRWYVSGHAPWSNAYESVIYVAWATLFFGLVLGKRNHLAIAATTFVTAIILWVAHENWLDPAIANLQPVLNSYWLMIHVAIIVASYGPFTLGMILGLINLLLIMLINKKNRIRMILHITELTAITEIALIIGLVMLTIGNFLGGQWANESWGRYWGWDPKETWALISIMIYALVLHLRLVPQLKNKWLFNFMAVISYASIMMTYFGVNFYLTGLHSYANGDSPITPNFIWYTLAFVTILGVLSYFKFKKTTTSYKSPL